MNPALPSTISQHHLSARPVRATATPANRQRSKASRWTFELALIAVLYGCYMAGRAAMGVHTGAAVARGQAILDLEAIAGLDIEQPLNSLVTAIPPVALVFAYLYATLHYVVTPVVLVWTGVRRGDGYRRARNALLVATTIGLLGYWQLPTAPPRLLDDGFIDVMGSFSDVGWWGDAASAPRGMESLSNQFAAFPSLHVGWAMWVALCLSQNVRSRALRVLGWAYPVLMSLVVMATANHYLLDAAAGIACAVLGYWAAGRWERSLGARAVPKTEPAHQVASRPIPMRTWPAENAQILDADEPDELCA